MRWASWFTLFCVLFVGAVGLAAKFDVAGVSSQPVTPYGLSRMMPGWVVAQGARGHDLWFATQGVKGWRDFAENFVAPPADYSPALTLTFVGTHARNLVLGGLQQNAFGQRAQIPIWYRDGMSWKRAICGDQDPFLLGRRIRDLAYGSSHGTTMYAFGAQTRVGFTATGQVSGKDRTSAAVWRSDDSGVHWKQILVSELADHEWCRGLAANGADIVYGCTEKSLIRLAPDSAVVWDFPSSCHNVLSLTPRHTHEVILVVGEMAPEKPRSIFDPPAQPLLHFYYSPNSMVSATELGTLFGAATAAQFQTKDLGVVAIPTDQPVKGTRVLCTQDACRSWKEDFFPGGRVEGIEIVNKDEIYLLVQSSDSGRLFCVKWQPPWYPAPLHIMTPQPSGGVFKKVE